MTSLAATILLSGVVILLLRRRERSLRVEEYRHSIRRALDRGEIDQQTAGYYLEFVERLPAVATRAPDPFLHSKNTQNRSKKETELTEKLAKEMAKVLWDRR